MRAADGEVRALRGYTGQYAVAAQLVYDALLEGDFDWIRLADPDAGRLDDLQIARPGRLDAYQVKWSEFEGRISFNSLITASGAGEGATPSPTTQLADGWRRLSATHPDRDVHVHYLTRDSASSADTVPGAPTGPAHLQRFLRDGFADRQNHSPGDDWADAFAAMQAVSEMPAHTFANFIANAHFDLGFRLSSHGWGPRREGDIQNLANYLLVQVGKGGGPRTWTRPDLLAAMGWRERLDLRFRHDFPVDERLYRPVQSTVDAFEEALAKISRGYLALLGPPGSGKSTTLTQLLRYRPGVRTIRYYAFVRGDPAQGRGEAEAFLHDLTSKLRDAGVRPAGAKPAIPNSRSELQDLLAAQLTALNADWTARGVLTLLLVDGLDHIDREQKPTVPLYEVLPSPDQIPDGVVIVLGSQPVGLSNVAARICAQLQEPGRTLTMGRLARGDVLAMSDLALGVERLTLSQQDAFFDLTQGHPLSVSYLLKRLADVHAPDAIDAILHATRPYEGDIEVDYRVYWQDTAADAEVRSLLGLLCRVRGDLDLALLGQLASDAVIERLLRRAEHYFHRETPRRWVFFHNSFRQFLIEATARTPFGDLEPGRDRAFHRTLAEHAAKAGPGAPFGWNLIHHLAKAGDDAAVLAAFSQAVFRRQFLALRPFGDIIEDITACLRAAGALSDRDAFIRGLLIENELRERQDALGDADLPDLLVELTEGDALADIAFDETGLCISEIRALKLAKDRAEQGDDRLARRLFDAAEPHAWLTGARPVSQRTEREHLKAWVRVAWRFRPIETVLALLGQVRQGKRRPGEPAGHDDLAEAQVDHLATELGEVLGQNLRRQGRDAALDQVATWLAARGERGGLALERFDYGDVLDATEGLVDRERGRRALVRLSAAWSPSLLDDGTRARMAALHVQFASPSKEIAAYLAAIEGPLSQDVSYDQDKTLAAWDPLFDKARALAALERPLDPVQTIPAPKHRGDTGGMMLQRMLILIATLRGEADRGAMAAPRSVAMRLTPAIRFIARHYREVQHWTDWYGVEARAVAYFRRVLNTAAAHGPEALRAVLEVFDDDWRTPPRSRYWRLAWRLAIVEHAHAIDPDGPRTRRWLEAIDASVATETELSSRIDLEAKLVRAWLRLGDRARARDGVARMVGATFGIYHDKDDQLERWSAWGAKAARLDPAISLDAVIRPLLRGAAVTFREHRGAERTRPAAILLSLAFERDPAWALALIDWLESHEATSRQALAEGVLTGALVLAATAQDLAVTLHAIARLGVPFTGSAPEAFAEAIGRACQPHVGEPTVQHAFAALLRTIDTKVPAGDRPLWRDRLAKAIVTGGGRPEAWGMEPDPPRVSRSGEIAPGLSLKGGGFISQQKLMLGGYGEDFVTLLEQTASIERLDYEAVLAVVLAKADAPKLRRARTLLADLGAGTGADLWFARACAAAGDLAEAQKAADNAYCASKPTGWSRYHDGGTRIRAAHAAIAVHGPPGRDMAFRWFSQDYLTEFRYPRDLLSLFDPVLEVLYAEPSHARLWPDVLEHVRQLIDLSKGELPDPPERGQRDQVSLTEGLFAWIARELHSPITELANEARGLIAELIRADLAPAAVHDLILGLLEAPDDYDQREGLVLLTCAERVKPGFARRYQQALERLHPSPSAIVRDLVDPLMEASGQSLVRPERALAPVFGLRIPPAAMANKSLFGSPEPGAALPDTQDRTELTYAFRPGLRLLARASGFDLDVLAERMVALMKAQAPLAMWDRAAEERIKSRVQEMEIAIPYRRPRITIGQLAFGRLVAELVDAGRAPWPFPALGPYLDFVDAGLVVEDPQPRPDWLVPPDGEPMQAATSKVDWQSEVDEALAGPSEIPDGGLVLAESTVFVRTDHDRPTEARAVAVDSDFIWSDQETPEDGHFAKDETFRVAAYPDLDLEAFPSAFILQGGCEATSEFLALSPDLGRFLGWRTSSQGLMAWEDDRGVLMAKSLWWRDGNVSMQNLYNYDGVSGEGWLVLLTAEGRQAMAPVLRDAERYISASRALRQHIGQAGTRIARGEQGLDEGALIRRR